MSDDKSIHILRNLFCDFSDAKITGSIGECAQKEVREKPILDNISEFEFKGSWIQEASPLKVQELNQELEQEKENYQKEKDLSRSGSILNMSSTQRKFGQL